jgi:hypothetical protein
MTNKLIFKCQACDAGGVIKITGDDEDIHEICVCPCCGNVFNIIDEDDEDEMHGYEN